MVDKWDAIRPWPVLLVTFHRLFSVPHTDLSYSMEVKSCGVGRAVCVGDGAVTDGVDEFNIDSVALAHNNQRAGQRAVVGND